MVFRFAYGVFWLYYHIFHRVRTEGMDKIPTEGSVVFCSNHISYHDPILLCYLLWKRRGHVHMIAKQELFQNKFFGWILRKLYAIPVNREKVEMSTFKAAMKVLSDGGALGIFAQGTRIKDFEAKDAKAGVALFALKGGAPVVPVYIDATYKPFSRVTVRFGEPLPLSEYKGAKLKTEVLNEAADAIMAEITKLAGRKA